MSGICAVWRTEHPEGTTATVTAVSRGLSLATDESVEQETDGAAGLGLSVRFSTQQIFQNPRLLLVCDADLYNENEMTLLAGVVEPAPAKAKTAALLAALYERCGRGFVKRLRGCFAVIIWDKLERRLIAAVDHFGIKRLAYHQSARLLLIGSRIDALMKSGEINPEINPRSIANILNFSVSLGPETTYAGVQRISPGCMLIASSRQIQLEKYWDMCYGAGNDYNEDRLSRKLESIVERSVAAHCKNEDHLGAFLSGGTDSSTVVGMMSRTQCGPVKAFSIGFEEQSFNELEYARIAARTFQAEHYTHLVSPADCFDALPHMVRYFDEPFANSSAIPTYFCARLAAQNGVKVLLAGDGGDELFGGNEAYRTEKIFNLYQQVPAFLRKGLVEPLLRAAPIESGLIGKARRYVRRSNIPPVERMLSYHFLCVHSLQEVFSPDFLTELAGYSVYDGVLRHLSKAPASDHLDRRLYADVKTVLGDSDLPKVTCMSELAGIQVRFPFADRLVAEFSGHIPARLKVKGLQKRYLFKRAFRDLLPIEIIQKTKHGFGIPVAVWMKSDPRLRDLAHDVLLSARAVQRGYFRRKFIEDLFRKYGADDTTYYGDTLWGFLVLELWHRQFLDQPVMVSA